MRKALIVIALGAALTIQACAHEPTSPGEASTSAGAAEDQATGGGKFLGKLSTVVQLRDAFVEAGGPCGNWELSNYNYGFCNDGQFRLGVYENQTAVDAEVQKQIDLARSVYRDAANVGNSTAAVDMFYVVGPNWMIGSENGEAALRDFISKRGGHLRREHVE